MDFKYMEEQGFIDSSLIDKWNTMDVGDEEEFEKWREEMLKELKKDPNYISTPDEQEYLDRLHKFWQDNCESCGTQRCTGVYDEEWRDGCVLYKKRIL